ncbi:MAG: PilZ domain-containing protein [Candidatus Omnitrophica bacterium]|nr:PilZ domain-containing protein [Candidatus Omnitrophota bacterium]
MVSWEEKREYCRAYVKIQVECRGKSYWQYVETRDISAGGMFVVTDKVEPANTKIEVMFDFGESEKRFIHAEGTVAWSRSKPFKDEKGEVIPAGMGIKFTKITPSVGKNFIDQIIKLSQERKNG